MNFLSERVNKVFLDYMSKIKEWFSKRPFDMNRILCILILSNIRLTPSSLGTKGWAESYQKWICWLTTRICSSPRQNWQVLLTMWTRISTTIATFQQKNSVSQDKNKNLGAWLGKLSLTENQSFKLTGCLEYLKSPFTKNPRRKSSSVKYPFVLFCLVLSQSYFADWKFHCCWSATDSTSKKTKNKQAKAMSTAFNGSLRLYFCTYHNGRTIDSKSQHW